MAQDDNDPHGLAPDRAATALLILDLISDFAFENGEAIARAALPVAKRIAKRKARVPVIYVNDDVGRWRSDFPALVRRCRESSNGAPIVEVIAPDPDDYCILKPKHSGFFATALDTILKTIGVSRLILTGVSSNQCVLFTANDAYIRDLELAIPRDCISAHKAADTALALRYFESVLAADIAVSSRVRLTAARKPRA